MSHTPAGTAEYTDERLNIFLERLLTTAEQTVFPQIDLALPENAQYDQSRLLELLAYCSIHGEFVNDGAKTRAVTNGEATTLRTDRRCPIARVFGHHLRKLDRDEIAGQFQTVRDEVCRLATRARLFTTPVTLAIDIHDWLYYGDKETDMVANTNPARGTDKAFKFVTACVVTEDLRFTVAVQPLATKREKADAVEGVLQQARKWIDIRCVYLDRGFYTVEVVQTLESQEIDFVMRAPTFPSLVREEPTVQVEMGYEMGGSHPPYDTVSVTRFTVPHTGAPEEKQTYFITNRTVTEAAAEGTAEAYCRRWGIETSYRVIGDFLARSRSTVYSVRLFYFLFAVTLYNLWVLINRLLVELFGRLTERPLVSAKVFGRLVRQRWMPDRLQPG